MLSCPDVAMLLRLAGVGYRQHMLYREGVSLRIPGTHTACVAAVVSGRQLCTAIVSCHP